MLFSIAIFIFHLSLLNLRLKLFFSWGSSIIPRAESCFQICYGKDVFLVVPVSFRSRDHSLSWNMSNVPNFPVGPPLGVPLLSVPLPIFSAPVGGSNLSSLSPTVDSSLGVGPPFFVLLFLVLGRLSDPIRLGLNPDSDRCPVTLPVW